MSKTMHDSGTRQQFEGGAQRDTAEGKPMMHLLSPHIYMLATRTREIKITDLPQTRDTVMRAIRDYTLTRDEMCLYFALDMMVDAYGVAILVEWLRLGAEKYDKFNWAKGMPFTRVLDSLLRHCSKWFFDDEDHPAAIMCNLMFLIHYVEEIKAERMHSKWDDLFKFEQGTAENPVEL